MHFLYIYMYISTVEGTRCSPGRGQWTPRVLAESGPLPAMADAHADHGGIGGHPAGPGGGREDAQQPPADQGGDRRLRSRVCSPSRVRTAGRRGTGGCYVHVP